MIKRIGTVVVVLLLTHGSRALAQCAGDCRGDGEVTVDELILGVNIALGSAQIGQCGSFDTNGDGDVTINELISAVNNALGSCQATEATPTPTGTPVPAASPTPTEGIVPPGISTRMLGIWSGRAVNETTGVDKPARIKVEVAGGKVVLTDLGGNIFASGPTITPIVATTTAVGFGRTVGSFPGGYAETLQLALAPNGQLAGTYGTTSLSFPPVLNGVALILNKES